MNKKYLYVTNWKMYLNYNQEIEWINSNLKNLEQSLDNNELILCPSFLSLSYFSKLLKSNIKLGAQNCSFAVNGAYTSQISAESLAQLNCNYSLVGHSECRQFLCDTDEIIAKKFINLINNNIKPILCIGESLQEYQANKTQSIIKAQLHLIKEITQNNSINEIIIAYEPIWSIGTGIIPTLDYLDKVFGYINQELSKIVKFKFLYGGSITSQNIEFLKSLDKIDGFLIGKASTDFQELKKIVIS